MSYLIDADVFIQAHRAHYGFEFVPGFWDWLDQAHRNGTVFSVDRVYEELAAGDDDALKAWIRARRELFLEPDDSVVARLRELSQWASDEQIAGRFQQSAVIEFTGAGDSQLIAHGAAFGFTVVTHETSQPDRMNKIKIPDACSAIGVRCITPFEMLVECGAKFDLRP